MPPVIRVVAVADWVAAVLAEGVEALVVDLAWDLQTCRVPPF